MKIYSSGEISKIFKCNRQQIIHLVERGIVTPLIDARGRGKVRIYSEQNIKQIKAAKNLIECGTPYRDIYDILKRWNNIDELIEQTEKYKAMFYQLKGIV